MKHIHFTLRLLLGVFTLGFLATGCITEDLDRCPVPTAYTLTLKVVNAAGEDITEGERVTDATIYVFDEEQNYIETVKVGAAAIKSHQKIVMDYPENDKKLYFVTWGNIADDKLIIQEGAKMSDFFVQLKTQDDLAEAPSDLFGGNSSIAISSGELTKDEEIVIAPKTAEVRLYTDGLQNRQALRSDEDLDFIFEVNNTLSQVGYDGTLRGDSVYYSPAGSWTEEGEWDTKTYSALMPGESIMGSLYINEEEYTHLKDSEDEPQDFEIDKRYELIFRWGDDGTYLGVKIVVRPWGFVDDEIEW